MLAERIDTIFSLIALGVGLVSIVMTWVYMAECTRNIQVIDLKTVRKFFSQPYYYSVIMLAILWITTDLGEILIPYFLIQIYGWMVTGVLALILSFIRTITIENRRSIRMILLMSVGKIVLLAFVLWMIY